LLAVLVAGVFSAAQAFAGQSAGEKEITTQDAESAFKLHVQRNMVLVRVIVRDSNGRPVAHLQKEDFRLFDNGKAQGIDQFAVESSGSASTLAPQPPGRESAGKAISEPATADSTPKNYQALYFDDVQMKFADIAQVRNAADRYLEAKLTPADRVGIFTSSGQGNVDFTDDRSKLHEALFKLQPRPTFVADTYACPDIGDYQAYLIVEQRNPYAIGIALDETSQCSPDAMAAQTAQYMVDGEAMRVLNRTETVSEAVLRGLGQVVRRTALLPGQRSVIFLSPGFLSYNLEQQINEISERALRSNVVINVLDPRGLYTVIPGGDASQPAAVLPRNAILAGNKQQIILDGISRAEDVLNDFAAATGGQFFHHSNDLDQGFRQVGTLAEVSYVLAFSPNNLKYDGRFHRLKVSLVNPARFTVQARRGYFAPHASLDAASKAKEEIEQAVYSQDELKEFPVDVHTQFYKINESDVRLAVLTHLDMSSVRFRKEQDRNLNDLTFLTVLFDRDGKYLTGKEKQVTFHLRDATLARLVRTGITLKTEFDLKPGTYMVRQIVRDSEAGQLSGLSRTVEIPY
jgi:VWFA-related protein